MTNRNYFLLLILGLMTATMTLSGCDDDEDVIDTPEETNRTTGFVIVGTTPSGSSLVKYVEELPANNVDLSDGTDYPTFFPDAIVDGAIYLARPDNGAGFSKFLVNAEGNLEEEGTLPTIDPTSFRIAVRDANTGVFQDLATPDVISVFDPETLEVTGTIDMSEAPVPGDVDQRYQRFIFRGDDVFSAIRFNDGRSFSSFVVHQADLGSNTYVGATQRDGNGVSDIVTRNNYGQNLTDDAGNLYLTDAGNYDGAGIPGAVNKIPAGQNQFDTSYQFFPARVLNPNNTFLPTFANLTIIEGSRAVALVNAETPQAAIDIVVAAGGVQNLSPDEIQQVLGILFTAESARLCELDLEAQTVTPIDGIPNVGAFAGGTTFFHDGAVFLPVATTTETAYYRYDIGSSTATRAFSITGVELRGMYNLGNDN